MDFYNPILSYVFFSNRNQSSPTFKDENSKIQKEPSLKFFLQPGRPIALYQLFVYKNKTQQQQQHSGGR